MKRTMTSDEPMLGRLLLIAGSLMVLLHPLACASAPLSSGAAGGSSGAAAGGGTTATSGGSAGVAGTQSGSGVGHNVPTDYPCTAPTTCSRNPLPPCMMWAGCEMRACVVTLAPGNGCAPNEVLPCNTAQVDAGIAVCNADCSFDSTCTPCGHLTQPCCPGPMGNNCQVGACVEVGYPTGTCEAQ
jgi:hypothetical protein